MEGAINKNRAKHHRDTKGINISWPMNWCPGGRREKDY